MPGKAIYTPIKFRSFGGYRAFCAYWWSDLAWYLIGYAWWPVYNTAWWGRWSTPGWLSDIRTFWLRGRYGWAPRDTWGLDTYVAGVLGQALDHLAEHSRGTPVGYMTGGGDEIADTDHERWEADLRRWAVAFREAAEDVDIYDAVDGYVKQRAEEQRRRDNLHTALKEIEPWWEALWD